MKLDIAGRVALVTGADSGIGKATALASLDEGVRVAITDRAGGALVETAAELAGHGELIGSEDGVQPYTDELAYCASKAAITTLAKGLSKAYGPDNVLVNSVSPAFIATPMTDAMMRKRAREQGTDFDAAIASFLAEERPGMALRRRGRPDEVADMILFLCSERASFINGANMRVDSGSVATI